MQILLANHVILDPQNHTFSPCTGGNFPLEKIAKNFPILEDGENLGGCKKTGFFGTIGGGWMKKRDFLEQFGGGEKTRFFEQLRGDDSVAVYGGFSSKTQQNNFE